MFRVFAFCCAIAITASIPSTVQAQCGVVPCVLYPYAPAIGAMVSGMGRSPGWSTAGRQILNQHPQRYPPTATWQAYSPPPGYYRPRPPPGVWYPRQRY